MGCEAVIALLAPGQGAQKPGMLRPWLEASETGEWARERLDAFSAAAELDLVHLGTEAGAEEIADTAITQPLLVSSALIAADALDARVALPADAPVAGHSIGELTAAAVAGVLPPERAVALAALRGREMARACAEEPTSMAAVLGGDEQAVLDALSHLGLEPANRNGSGQIVAAGAVDAIVELTDNPPEGVRARRLSVAGAFHTRYMAPAEKALRDWVDAHRGELGVADPDRPLLSDADGAVVTSGEEYLDRLVAQVTRSVRWDACMDTLGERGVTAVVELCPGGTLIGMVKRALKGSANQALTTPDQLGDAADLVTAHGGSLR